MAETSCVSPFVQMDDVQCGSRATWTNPWLPPPRARRRRWPTRISGDTGEAEVEVPAALLDIDFIEIELEPDLLLRERVAPRPR